MRTPLLIQPAGRNKTPHCRGAGATGDAGPISSNLRQVCQYKRAHGNGACPAIGDARNAHSFDGTKIQPGAFLGNSIAELIG
jgi:hypothetical protein